MKKSALSVAMAYVHDDMNLHILRMLEDTF